MWGDWGIQTSVRACLVNSRTSVWAFLQYKRLTSFVLWTVGCCSSAEVSLLVGHSLDADVNIVFAGDKGQLIVVDVAVKSFKFRVVAVYAPNTTVKRVSFFHWLAPFLDDPKWLVLMGDWNVILDPKIDKVGQGASRLGRCENSQVDFMARHDLIDRIRLDHPRREMWT